MDQIHKNKCSISVQGPGGFDFDFDPMSAGKSSGSGGGGGGCGGDGSVAATMVEAAARFLDDGEVASTEDKGKDKGKGKDGDKGKDSGKGKDGGKGKGGGGAGGGGGGGGGDLAMLPVAEVAGLQIGGGVYLQDEWKGGAKAEPEVVRWKGGGGKAVVEAVERIVRKGGVKAGGKAAAAVSRVLGYQGGKGRGGGGGGGGDGDGEGGM